MQNITGKNAQVAEKLKYCKKAKINTNTGCILNWKFDNRSNQSNQHRFVMLSVGSRKNK